MSVDPSSRGWNEHRHRWDVPAGTIHTADLADGSVTTPKIATGAAQTLLGSTRSTTAFSTTTVGPWVETPFTVTVTCTGVLVRIEGMLPLYHSVAGAGVYVGWGLDHVIQAAGTFFNVPAASSTLTGTFIDYATPTAASHVFSLFVLNNTAGTLTYNPAVAVALYVTEQRR